MRHIIYPYIKALVQANMVPILVGPAGTGKTTIAMTIAEELGLEFRAMSLTKQTSKGDFLGFISVNGNYIRTHFREAVEHGHLFLLDELDAADNNTILILNSLENGYVAFPDKMVDVHPNFRLVATANPFNDHSTYTGRSKLDFSTINRFMEVQVDLDRELMKQITSSVVMEEMEVLEHFLKVQGNPFMVTMRDAIRYHKLLDINIPGIDPIEKALFTNRNEYFTMYNTHKIDAAEQIRKEKEAAEKRRLEEEERQRVEAMTQQEVDDYATFKTKIQQGK